MSQSHFQVVCISSSIVVLRRRRAWRLRRPAFGDLQLRSIGPCCDGWPYRRCRGRGGRTPWVTCTSGVLLADFGKRTNHGTTWTPVFDRSDDVVDRRRCRSHRRRTRRLSGSGPEKPNNRQSSSFGRRRVSLSTTAARAGPTSVWRTTRPHRPKIVDRPNPARAGLSSAALGSAMGRERRPRGVYRTLDARRELWTRASSTSTRIRA